MQRSGLRLLFDVVNGSFLRSDNISYRFLALPNPILIPQFSWVETEGSVIPAGALVGGRDVGGRPLYIGRACHDNGLTPGNKKKNKGNWTFC